MDFLHSNKTTKWKKRPINLVNYRILLFTLFAVFFFTAIFILSPSPTPFFQNSQSVRHSQCARVTSSGEKFLLYAPHSGFSNQLFEFKNAILIAAILNRTLIIPPVLDHHAVSLGSCPKFRVSSPNEIRYKVWDHTIQLIREHRYISMADVIDLSSLTSNSAVRFMDFRVFIPVWCEVDSNFACTKDWKEHSSLNEKLRKCGSVLSGYDGNINKCFYASPEDCRTTVWTYQDDGRDGTLDSFQAEDELRKRKKISFMRKRKDVYNAYGPNSASGSATVLAFGSLFTAPYKGSESHIDIREAPKDQRIQLLMQKIEFLPFVFEVMNAGKKYALETIKGPFLCAQLRLLDGQFKNHWKGTFLGMKKEIDSLIQKGPLPIHVFIMTDLPQSNWMGSYLGDLNKDSTAVKLFFLDEDDDLVVQTAEKIVNAGHGLKYRDITRNFDGMEQRCNSISMPDTLLYLEETICSCASLGFVGTSGSTIAESIELMRKNNICSI